MNTPRYRAFQCVETSKLILKDEYWLVCEHYEYPQGNDQRKVLRQVRWSEFLTREDLMGTPILTSIYTLRYA